MKLLLACLTVILSGCGTVGLKVSENVTRVPDGRGIVILSTGADSTSLSFSTSLILVDAASRKFYDKVVIQVDAPVAASHVPGEHAHIRSLELPQGSYFLVPRIANPYTKMVEYPVHEFLVRSGEIT